MTTTTYEFDRQFKPNAGLAFDSTRGNAAWLTRTRLEARSRCNRFDYHRCRSAIFSPKYDESGVKDSFFLVAWIVDLVADEQAEDALGDTESRLESIRQQHGLDDDAPADENAPPEYREAMQASHDAWDELYAATLDDLGELEMAQLFRADNDQFECEYKAGQRFFHGEDKADQDWLDELLDAVSACVEAESLMAPLGLRYFEDDGLWEIVIYPSPVELVGGAHDGEVVTPGFLVDLELLREAFDEVRHFGWNPNGLSDPDGPYVSVEGVFQGKEVFVRLLAYAPEGEEPGIKVDANGKWRYRHE